jgi:hypothetical protein
MAAQRDASVLEAARPRLDGFVKDRSDMRQLIDILMKAKVEVEVEVCVASALALTLTLT